MKTTSRLLSTCCMAAVMSTFIAGHGSAQTPTVPTLQVPAQVPAENPKPVYQYETPPLLSVITPAAPITQTNQVKASFVSPTNGKHYFFTNKRYFRYGADTGFDKAANIKNNWRGIPESFDAAYVSSKNKKAYFFKGNKYYRYSFKDAASDNNTLPISRYWVGIPNNIDAVVEHPNGKVYFFKGDTYYRYANKKVEHSAKISRGWSGVPDNVDAALLHANGKIYFIKGDQYYRYDIEARRVDREGTVGEKGWRGLDFTKKNFTKKVRRPLQKVSRVSGGKVTQELLRNAADKTANISATIDKKDKEGAKGTTCTTQSRKFSEAKIDHFLKASNSPIKLPGNVINGRDLFTGDYNIQNVEKNKYRVFISPSIPRKDNYVDINDPSSQSEVSRAIDLLKSWHLPSNPVEPENTAINITKIESATEAKLAIGGSFSSPFVDVNSLFDFNTKKKSKKYLAEYAATYYTITLEKLSNDPIVKSSSPTNPDWVYVSEVKYGKRYLFSLESNDVEKHSSSDLDVNGNYGVYQADLSINSVGKDISNITSSKQVVQGGRILDLKGDFPDNITAILSKDSYSKSKPGTAIASKLSFVDNDKVAHTTTTADYTEKVCFRTSNVFKVTLENITAQTQDDGPGDYVSEIFGDISLYVKNARGEKYTSINNSYGAKSPSAKQGKNVWKVSEDNAKDMSNGSTIPIDRSLIFKVPYQELQNAKLSIHGNLYEEDSFGNDVVGRNIVKIDLKTVTQNVIVGGVNANPKVGQYPVDPAYRSDEGVFYVPVAIEPITE